MIRRAVDYALFPALVLAPTLAAIALLDRRVPPLVVTPIVVGAFTAVVFVLERLRYERADYRKPDQPIWIDAAHFLFSFELGYGLALAATGALGSVLKAHVALPAWPASWPLGLQILLAVLLYEGTSYWQHRWLHTVPRLWRFHALHHKGSRMNFTRSIRFHMVDLGTASFVAYVPLTLWGSPESLQAILGVLLSALGMLQHANIRMRTPRWLDLLVCTPALHRHHHSIVQAEADNNYGNTVMIFDHLFGTYAPARSQEGPPRLGMEHDDVPATFWGQWIGPFLPSRSAETRAPERRG